MTIGIEATKAFEKQKTGIGWYAYYIIKYMLKSQNSDVNFVLYANPARIFNFQFSINYQLLITNY